MEDRSGIRLDPDVIESGDTGRIPLSDLYGFPVFTDDTDRKLSKLRTDREDTLACIRREVFGVRGCGEEEMLWGIRRQIFQVTQEQMMSETVEKTEVRLEMRAFWGILMTGTFILLLGYKKIRRSGKRK